MAVEGLPKPYLSPRHGMVVQWRTRAGWQRIGRRWVGEMYHRLPSPQADGAHGAPALPAGDESAQDCPGAFARSGDARWVDGVSARSRATPTDGEEARVSLRGVWVAPGEIYPDEARLDGLDCEEAAPSIQLWVVGSHRCQTPQRRQPPRSRLGRGAPE